MFRKNKKQILNNAKVFDINNFPQLIKAHKKYVKLDKLSTNAFLKHEKLLKSTDCFTCEVYYADLNRAAEERNKNCAGCKYSYVGEAYHEFLTASDNVDKYIQNEYSKVIFDILSELKPDLIKRGTGDIFSWEEVFPKTFDECNKNNRKALFSIVEENGGPYRIKS